MQNTTNSFVPFALSSNVVSSDNTNTILIDLDSSNKPILKYSTEESKFDINSLNDIKRFCFEYILARLSQISSFSENEFTEKNELTTPKVLMYPFFVSMSNGHSKSLFNILGPFKTNFIGPISESLLGLLDKGGDKLEYFDTSYLKSKRYNLNLKNKNYRLSDIIEQIKNKEVYKRGTFKDIIIKNNKNEDSPLCYALDRGIFVLMEQTSKQFIKLDSDRLLSFAKYYSELNRLFNENKFELFEYDKLKEEESPFYNF